MVDFADLAKPVAASVLLGLSSGWLTRTFQIDVLPFALATLLVILLAAVAQIRRSRGLARAARATAAAVAAWFLAEVLARLGAPPYAAIPLAPLFYRFVFAPASVLGGAFGAHVGPSFAFVALVVSALDVLLVYRTRLFVASASLNGATEEMSARFRTFTLGFADFFCWPPPRPRLPRGGSPVPPIGSGLHPSPGGQSGRPEVPPLGRRHAARC